MQFMDLTPSRSLVLKKLRDCFPATDIASTALDLLDSYGNESWHFEKDRVQLAILKLSNGELKKLSSLVEVASSDYRDVLALAEYPEVISAAFSTPAAEMNSMRQRDLDQYLRWLNSDG
jgi:hypothetical protein